MPLHPSSEGSKITHEKLGKYIDIERRSQVILQEKGQKPPSPSSYEYSIVSRASGFSAAGRSCRWQADQCSGEVCCKRGSSTLQRSKA